MSRFLDFLKQQFGTAARVGLGVGAVLIVVVTVVVAYAVLRTDYQVLFSELTPQDTAAMTAELDRLKIPYVLNDPGSAEGSAVGTIMVDRSDVYRTRIKLMGKDIPLHGAVGLELFNNNDLGMTEFAQRINYQRALQGELTRTILSLAEVRDARILLAIPDQGLFKQTTIKPKASVTITLKPGQHLRAEQVSGIQRLVSAAVSGIQSQDVTIIDQSGVALTRAVPDGTQDDAGAANARLDLKKDTESYLSRKVASMLERALGADQASATVDVTLNMDRVQSSTDEPMGPPAKPGEASRGVITREREAARDTGAPLGPSSATSPVAATLGGSNQREVEYAIGHRIEQVISQPGSVRRIDVAVVVRKSLSAQQQEQLRVMVAAAVGASLERGDSVVVQAFDGPGSRTDWAGHSPVGGSAAAPVAIESSDTPRMIGDKKSSPEIADVPSPSVPRMSGAQELPYAWAAGAAFMLGLSSLAWLRLRGRNAAPAESLLTDAQRQEVLAKLQGWLQEGERAQAVASLDAAEKTAQVVR